MGGKGSNRQPRLRDFRETQTGCPRLVTCTACGYQATLPIAAMIRRFGELGMMEFALVALRCSACDHYGPTASMVRLCDPGCPRRTVGGNRVAAE